MIWCQEVLSGGGLGLLPRWMSAQGSKPSFDCKSGALITSRCPNHSERGMPQDRGWDWRAWVLSLHDSRGNLWWCLCNCNASTRSGIFASRHCTKHSQSNWPRKLPRAWFCMLDPPPVRLEPKTIYRALIDTALAVIRGQVSMLHPRGEWRGDASQALTAWRSSSRARSLSLTSHDDSITTCAAHTIYRLARLHGRSRPQKT